MEDVAARRSTTFSPINPGNEDLESIDTVIRSDPFNDSAQDAEQPLTGRNEPRSGRFGIDFNFNAKRTAKYVLGLATLVFLAGLIDLIVIARTKPAMHIDSASLSFSSTSSADASLTVQGKLGSYSSLHALDVASSHCEFKFNEDGSSELWRDVVTIRGKSMSTKNDKSKLVFEFQDTDFSSVRHLLYSTAWNDPLGASISCSINVDVSMYRMVTVPVVVQMAVSVLSPSGDEATVQFVTSGRWDGRTVFDKSSVSTFQRSGVNLVEVFGTLFNTNVQNPFQYDSVSSAAQSVLGAFNQSQPSLLHVNASIPNPFFSNDTLSGSPPIPSFLLSIPAITVASTVMGDVEGGGRFFLSSSAFSVDLMKPMLHVETNLDLKCSNTFTDSDADDVELAKCGLPNPMEWLRFYGNLLSGHMHLSVDAVGSNFLTNLAGPQHFLLAEPVNVTVANAFIRARLPTLTKSASLHSSSNAAVISHLKSLDDADSLMYMGYGVSLDGSCIRLDTDGVFIVLACTDVYRGSAHLRLLLYYEYDNLMTLSMRYSGAGDRTTDVGIEMGFAGGRTFSWDMLIADDNMHSLIVYGFDLLRIETTVDWSLKENKRSNYVTLNSQINDSLIFNDNLYLESGLWYGLDRFRAVSSVGSLAFEATGNYSLEGPYDWYLNFEKIVAVFKHEEVAAVHASIGSRLGSDDGNDVYADAIMHMDVQVASDEVLSIDGSSNYGHHMLSTFVNVPNVRLNVLGETFLNLGGDGYVGEGSTLLNIFVQDANVTSLGSFFTVLNWDKPEDRNLTTDGYLNVTSVVHFPFFNLDLLGSLNYSDHEYFLNITDTYEDTEVFRVLSNGSFAFENNICLLAVENATLFVFDSKVFSFVSLTDVTSLEDDDGADLLFQLQLLDSYDTQVLYTSNSLSYSKPYYATWADAGSIEFKSVFDPRYYNASIGNGQGNHTVHNNTLTNNTLWNNTELNPFARRHLGMVHVGGAAVCDASTTDLDLSYQGLTEMPDLSDCINLQSLTLEGNSLTNLSSSLFRLSKLVDLDLSKNNLTHISSSINRLDLLESLYLQDNQLVSLPNELGGLVSLLEIYLDGNQLTYLPAGLSNANSLQLLSARENQLTNIPYDYQSLTNLLFVYLSENRLTGLSWNFQYFWRKVRELDIRHNNFASIPSWLFTLPDLESLRYDGEPTISCSGTTTTLDLSYRGYYTFNMPSLSACSNLQSLNLNGNHLEELPDDIYRLSQLRYLYVSNNRLISLSASIEALSQLIQLDVSYNLLEALPDEIGGLLNLQHLTASGNSLLSLPYEIGLLTALRYLDLRSNRLSYVPVEIGDLMQLQQLILSSNYLVSLPTEIGQLTQLTYLSLEYNYAFAGFPDEIVNLVSLQHLQASRCFIASLPADFGNLVELQYLYLSSNRLTSLPSSIGSLTKLLDLQLNSNALTALPSEIGNCISLFYLSLFGNHLTSLPSSIGRLARLNSISLEYNSLSSLPDSIGGLLSLGTLWADGNRLTALPETIGNLTSLAYLGVSSNRITDLPDGLYDLTALVYLSIGSNSIQHLSPKIAQLRYLTNFLANYNQISSIPAGFAELDNLQQIQLSNNQVGRIPAVFCNMTNLQYIDLSYNSISRVSPAIGTLHNLRTLYLSGNIIQDLPWEMVELANLQTLDISMNSMHALPSVVYHFPSLLYLRASSNFIQYLSEDIGLLVNVQILDLSNNMLLELPPQIGNMTQMRYMYLYNNRLTYLPVQLLDIPDFSMLEVSSNRLVSISPLFFQKPGFYLNYYNNPVWCENYGCYNDDDDDTSLSLPSIGWNVTVTLTYDNHTYNASLIENDVSGQQNVMIGGGGEYRKFDEHQWYLSANNFELHFGDVLIGSTSGYFLAMKREAPNDSESENVIDVVLDGRIFDNTWTEVFAVNTTSSWQLIAPPDGHCSISGSANTTSGKLLGWIDFIDHTYSVFGGEVDLHGNDGSWGRSFNVPKFLPDFCPSAHHAEESFSPTSLPSISPTSSQPSSFPTPLPTPIPTTFPTSFPTPVPTTFSPSLFPTSFPTMHPITPPPTVSPTTLAPTVEPTIEPSLATGTSHEPSKEPTASPSRLPSFTPTCNPTATPTVAPSQSPTNEPTVTPSEVPSAVPSQSPSNAPTCAPSENPSAVPTRVPSQAPTYAPSQSPTVVPSRAPSYTLTTSPTAAPSFTQTGTPTVTPSSRGPTIRPTPRPTAVPTLRPSAAPSTTAPTLNSNAPVISSLTSSALRSSISLTATFTSASVYAGTVTCAAFAESSSITSNQQVITATSAKSAGYLAGYSTVSVTLTGLDAVNTYDIYCSVMTINGVSGVLTDTLTTKRTVTTACCKTLTFTNTPSFVYGDVSLYSSSQPNQYVFSYVLSSVPGNTVTITPKVTFVNGTSANMVTVTRSSTTFTSTSSNLNGKFVLSASSALSGTFQVVLLPSGTSAAQFGNATASVSIISSSAPKPAPNLLSVKFANSGGSLAVSFDYATNKASISASTFTCSQVFSFTGDSSSTCSWVNSTAVKAVLPSDSTLSVNDIVTLRANLIKAECATGKDCSAYSAAAAQSVAISAPDTPLVPSVLLSTPSIISSCDNVTIDPSLSTGSGGRAWSSVVWTVSRADALGIVAVPNVLYALNNRGTDITSPITLARSLFTPSTYTITLTLTNFFGSSASATSIFTLDENPNLPVVTILGPSERTMSPKDTLALYTSTTQASCAEKASTISYKWTVSQNGNVITKASTSATPTKFSLLSYSLTAGNVYTFHFEATAKATTNTAAITGRASTIVKVVDGAVVVVVVGGYKRQVPTVGQLTIDASSSYDENVQSTSASGLSFVWTCTFSSAARYGESCSSVLPSTTTASTLVVDATLLESGNLYDFQVVAKASDGRSGLAVVTVQPQVSGSSTYSSITSLVTKVNPDSRMSLTGVVRASYALDCAWTASIDGVSTSFSALTSASETFTKVAVRNNFIYPLVVAGKSFVAGSTVTFRLGANFAGNSSRYAAYSEVVVKMNAAPNGGSLITSPSTGSALSTVFTVSSSGWVDDPEDFPLTYQFVYKTLTSEPALNLQSRSPSNKASSDLPAGPDSTGNLITLLCNVFDVSLATASVSSTVTVTENVALDVSQYLSDKLSSFDSVGDVNTVGQLIANVGNTVNKANCTLASSTFCASKHRAACSQTPQKCGSCLTGYRGVVGDDNSMCFSNSTASSSSRRRLLGSDVGGACSSDDDCLLGKCGTHAVCVTPSKTCPSDTSDVCSGHGSCEFTTRSGKPLNKTCTVMDFECTAQCVCSDGYGGRSCGLTPEKLATQDSIRASLCSAVVTVGNNSDVSAQLLESLIGYMDSAYDAHEVTTEASLAVCKEAMQFVADLLLDNSDLVSDIDESKLQLLLKTAAKFVVSNDNATTEEAEYIHNLVSTLNEAILTSMVNGQSSFSYASQNMRTIISKAKIGEVTSIYPPATDDESYYGNGGVTSYIEVVNTSTSSHFANSEGYLSLVVMLWGANPFPGAASSVESTLLRVENHNANAASSRRLVAEGDNYHEDHVGYGSQHLRGRQLATSSSNTVDYYIVVQLNEKHSFDRSHTYSEAQSLGLTNITFPSCTNYDGSGYTNCSGCYVSTYTDYNVTFACTADSSGIDSRRRLSTSSSSSSVMQVGATLVTPTTGGDDTDSSDSSSNSDRYKLTLGLAIGLPLFVLVLVAMVLGFVYYTQQQRRKGAMVVPTLDAMHNAQHNQQVVPTGYQTY